MRIVSSYKDYYDYISQHYGFDPDVLYLRRPIDIQKIPESVPCKTTLNALNLTYEDLKLPSQPSSVFNATCTETFSFLFCAGTLYLLVGKSGGVDYDVFTPEKYPKLINHIIRKGTWQEYPLSDYTGMAFPKLNAIAKILNQPVFIISSDTTLSGGRRIYRINTHIPVLAQLGFAPLIPPSNMYQNIYSFILNVLRDSPDIQPPIEVSNNVKILQHGFDLDKSFRHRK